MHQESRLEIRIDTKEKAAFYKAAKKYGLKPAAIIRLLMRRFVKTGDCHGER